MQPDETRSIMAPSRAETIVAFLNTIIRHLNWREQPPWSNLTTTETTTRTPPDTQLLMKGSTETPRMLFTRNENHTIKNRTIIGTKSHLIVVRPSIVVTQEEDAPSKLKKSEFITEIVAVEAEVCLRSAAEAVTV